MITGFDPGTESLATGVCPMDGGTSFYFGPWDGEAREVECASCGARFDVSVYRGAVVYATRIDRGARTSQWSQHFYSLFQLPPPTPE